MILAETVLPKLVDWHAPGEGRHLLTVPDEGSGWAVALTIDRQAPGKLAALSELLVERRRKAALHVL